MKFGTRTLLATTALMLVMATAAHSKPMNFVGDWSNTARYAVGQVVQYNGALFYALQSTRSAPNVNLIPSNNPTWWAPVGTIGNTLLNGVGNPTSPSLGQVGDFYINTETNTLFGPKTAIAPYWPASGVALSGIDGQAGATGPAGPAGPAGATGLAGADGAAGPEGPQGPTGPAGADGATGPAGPAGPAGATGPAGPQGPTGPAGADGATGPAGPQGPTGLAGADGAAGPAGPAGATGPAGPQGPTGPAGATGPAGPTPPPTLTVSVNCSSGGSIQQAIDNVVGGTVATINVSGACTENLTISRGKTINLVGSSGTSLIPLNDASPAIFVRGELTVQGFDIQNTTGSADELVTAQTGSITIIGSRLTGTNVETVVGVNNNSFGNVWNSVITAGTGSGLSSFGGGVFRIGSNPDLAAGPNGYATNISTTTGFAAVGCAPGGSIYTRVSANANGTGSISITGGQQGIYTKGCSLNLANLTNSRSNQTFSGSNSALQLMNSQMSISNASITNSGNGINAVNSSVEVSQTTISNSDRCGALFNNSAAQLETSSITGSAIGICVNGGNAEITGGMELSSNTSTDLYVEYRGTIALHPWNGPSTIASINCLADGLAYVDVGAAPDLTTNYSAPNSSSPCLSLDVQ